MLRLLSANTTSDQEDVDKVARHSGGVSFMNSGRLAQSMTLPSSFPSLLARSILITALISYSTCYLLKSSYPNAVKGENYLAKAGGYLKCFVGA